VVGIGAALYVLVTGVALLFCVNVTLRAQLTVNGNVPSADARSLAGTTKRGSDVEVDWRVDATLPVPVPANGDSV
jgi:hypothetical protein